MTVLCTSTPIVWHTKGLWGDNWLVSICGNQNKDTRNHKMYNWIFFFNQEKAIFQSNKITSIGINQWSWQVEFLGKFMQYSGIFYPSILRRVGEGYTFFFIFYFFIFSNTRAIIQPDVFFLLSSIQSEPFFKFQYPTPEQ